MESTTSARLILQQSPHHQHIFDALLEKLRAVHSEVCERNALLEKQNRNLCTGVNMKSERKHTVEFGFEEHGHLDAQNEPEDDPWFPAKFRALEDDPLPIPVPRRAGSPKIYGFQLIETSARHSAGEDLQERIGELVRQQADLSEQIRETLSWRPGKGRVSTVSHSSRAHPPACASITSNAFVSKALASTTSSAYGEKRAKRTSLASNLSKGSKSGKARFGVDMKASVRSRRTLSFAEDPLPVGSVAGFRQLVRMLVSGTAFSLIATLLTVSYALLVAAETHMISQDPEASSSVIQTLHYVYVGLWCLESSLYFIGFGVKAYTGKDAFWNRLDLAFIASGFTEIILENAGSIGAMASVVRGVRICRVFRTIRLLRTCQSVLEFQKMAFALVSCFRTLLCSFAILSFVMFFFAVWFTQTAADVEMRKQIPDLELRYGDLWSTTYTLFSAISNGISWDVCYTPLRSLSWLPASAFLVYIFTVLFGLVNVVTSVFVESVIRSVQHHKDILIMDQEEAKKTALNHIKDVFRAVDGDHNGTLHMHEMERFLEDPQTRNYMAALDIQAKDTHVLFKMVDTDGSGTVDVEEFCEACLKLKGNAKSMDVHILCFQIKQFLAKWGDFTLYVEESFAKLRKKLP